MAKIQEPLTDQCFCQRRLAEGSVFNCQCRRWHVQTGTSNKHFQHRFQPITDAGLRQCDFMFWGEHQSFSCLVSQQCILMTVDVILPHSDCHELASCHCVEAVLGLVLLTFEGFSR